MVITELFTDWVSFHSLQINICNQGYDCAMV